MAYTGLAAAAATALLWWGCILCMVHADAVEHAVGGSIGWTIPKTVNLDSDFYEKWSNNNTFRQGDTLLFNYARGFHNVVVVSEKNFKDCNDTSSDVYGSGKSVITLNRRGDWYFICGYPQHCFLGQALKLQVAAASAPTTSTPSSATPLILAKSFVFSLVFAAVFALAWP